jgi:hypothetical protein
MTAIIIARPAANGNRPGPVKVHAVPPAGDQPGGIPGMPKSISLGRRDDAIRDGQAAGEQRRPSRFQT